MWPHLQQENATHIGIYVRFSDQDPIRTIAKAIAEQLEVLLDWLIASASAHTLAGGGHPASATSTSRPTYAHKTAPLQFQKLLTAATDAVEKPLVLLLDQFEQFFVHYKRVDQRQPFVQALTQWYRTAEPLPVKILVSIRSDLMYQLDDLHQVLGYALGPQEVVQLKKFTPEEAAAILGVIAQAEHLDFERRFVVDLADQELANREDGLISPVDLQILAWMIDRQTGTATRAFNRTAFQKFVGVEGTAAALFGSHPAGPSNAQPAPVSGEGAAGLDRLRPPGASRSADATGPGRQTQGHGEVGGREGSRGLASARRCAADYAPGPGPGNRL